jgi:hypothetical protein
VSDDTLCYTYYRCASYMVKVKARDGSNFPPPDEVGKVESGLSGGENLGGAVIAGLNATMKGWNTTAGGDLNG